MFKTAILILNYNGRTHLETYLPEILRTTSDIPVVIGDNASTDNSVSWVKLHYPELRIVQLDRNYGYSEGYNRLIDLVDARYLVLMNSDVRPTDNWLSPLTEYLDNNEEVAAIMPKILSEQKTCYFEYAGAAGGYLDKYGYPFCRGRLFDSLEKDEGQYDSVRQVFWLSGSCFVIRKDAFIKSGGFDPDFFAHMEEIDLCWRMLRLGYKLVCYPKSTVFHLGGGTLSYNDPFKSYLNHRNGIILLLKNLPARKKLSSLTIRIILDWISIGYYIVNGQGKRALSVIQAHWYIISHQKQIKQSGQVISIDLEHNQQPQLYHKSIVWQYFIKKKKKFTDLVPD